MKKAKKLCNAVVLWGFGIFRIQFVQGSQKTSIPGKEERLKNDSARNWHEKTRTEVDGETSFRHLVKDHSSLEIRKLGKFPCIFLGSWNFFWGYGIFNPHHLLYMLELLRSSPQPWGSLESEGRFLDVRFLDGMECCCVLLIYPCACEKWWESLFFGTCFRLHLIHWSLGFGSRGWYESIESDGNCR